MERGFPVHARWNDPAPADFVRRSVAKRADGCGVQRHLVPRSPRVQLPSDYVLLPALRPDADGKVDRRNLPAPAGRPEQDRVHRTPCTPVDERLASIWMEALRHDEIDVEDDSSISPGIRSSPATGLERPVAAV